jgi:predicted Zn finger-like uncharacterized protein
MSLATRCPACGTIFRVVQDQLKVSEGWVRCGQCHEVFHGIEALFDLDSDPAIAARRAAGRGPVAAPPTRVFAEQRANAPIPSAPPLPDVAPPAPATIPAGPAPAAAQSVSATPSAFATSDYAPSAPAARPGYTGFTPATQPAPPEPLPTPPAPWPVATPSPMQPLSTRGSIAPRFAARLAEESARAQAATSSPIPSAYPPLAAPRSLSPSPASFGSELVQPTAPGWQPPPAPVPVPLPAPIAASAAEPPPAMYIPPSLLARAPLVATPAAPTSSAADLASEFAAPSPTWEAAAESAPSTALVRPPTPDVGGSTMPSLLAQDAADEARSGPPTLASMLPEDAGDWPPRRAAKKRVADSAGATHELALVDRSKDPRFLREAKSGARWRRPWVRAALNMALLLLIVAAVGQVAWPQRDTLAARWPAARPAWDWLCEQAACRIEAPRAISSLALDGSSLTRTDTDHVLLFAADLHNRADHEVRMPSFDVTFMDLNGEIVSRKVLTPEDLGIHQASLPAEGELHVHARLQVGTLAASGFQADLFYP